MTYAQSRSMGWTPGTQGKIEGDVVVLFQTGCAMVVTTGYPATAHRINYIHNLFQNGAATLSGLVEVYHERIRRGELPASKEITFFTLGSSARLLTSLET